MSKLYKVSWVIDISADDPVKAALEAQSILEEYGVKWYFLITDDKNNSSIVDLEDDNPKSLPLKK